MIQQILENKNLYTVGEIFQERFLEFFEVFKDCFMSPEFYNDGPYDYTDTEILRVQQIIQNVIKTTDSKETMLIKKREIRMIGDDKNSKK